MKKRNNNHLKKNILKEAKKHIIKNGWNENLFNLIAKNRKFNINDIKSLFQEDYTSLLKFYLEELNNGFILKAKKLNLKNFRTHIKIRELILLRLNLYQKEKKIIKKTYFSLLLPKHFNISSYALYKTVNEIWFLAGDKSTDFNFYSKRAILSTIYSSVIFHWINNDDINLTKLFLDKQLLRVSKIPIVKGKIKNFSSQLPNGLKIYRRFFSTMQ